MASASTPTPTPTGNERIARRFPEEVASEGSVGLIDEICAEDVLDHSPLGEVRGRDELKAQISGLKESFSDFSATVEDAVTEGDTVAMRVTLRGTHDGAFMGIEPTGKPIEVGNMVFTRIEDGVIAERWVQPDMLGMLTQLGAVEPPTA
ncbi:ester cyclase [Haloferax volcanii]|uniref:ester cyclase n=1 Tax=Haloferax volcanii TaxID=2246 RepID=UPI0023DCDF83|nr:ester cyclase [Haloferax lucentense]WEL24872.1 Putative ester cyclase [Haloferax lucentense]